MSARVGQVYVRREPAGDQYDTLTVVGFNSGEVALRCADGLEVVGADPAALEAAYVLEHDAPARSKPTLATEGGDALAIWREAV